MEIVCIKKELTFYIEKFAATCLVQFGSVSVLGSSKINAVGYWYVYVPQTDEMPRNERASERPREKPTRIQQIYLY